MICRLANRVIAIACIAAIAAILASSLWCESACIADQPGVNAADTTTCHDEPVATVAVSSHHDCRDHQIESLTATAMPRGDVLHGALVLVPLPFIADPTNRPDVGYSAHPTHWSSPPARAVAVLRI